MTIDRRAFIGSSLAALSIHKTASAKILEPKKLTMDLWKFQLDHVKKFESINVLDAPFANHVHEAMKKLIASFGVKLKDEAVKLKEANGTTRDYPVPNDELIRLLEKGEFNFIRKHELHFVDMDIKYKDKALGLVKPSAHAHIVFINTNMFAKSVSENWQGHFSSGDKNARFQHNLAQTILHEMIHLEGYLHPEEADFDKKSAYMKSFPKIADIAYFNLHKDAYPMGAGSLVGDTSSDGKSYPVGFLECACEK